MPMPLKEKMSNFSFGDVHEGTERTHSYEITAAVHRLFVETFEDTSPLHTDEGYAKSHGFDGRVVHGGILHGFLSHFIGIYFPGENSLLLSADLYYLRPSYLGDVLELHAMVTQKVEVAQTLVLKIQFLNRTQGTLVAKGRVHVRIRNA